MEAVQQELDALDSLEERISRAVELVASLRKDKAELESQLDAAFAERDAARHERDSVRQEMDELRSERTQVRTRIEKLIGQMDLLSGA